MNNQGERDYPLMIKAIIRKLFATCSFFTIALKPNTCNPILDKKIITTHTVLADRTAWCADPFLAQDGERTFLFYEKVNNNVGSIEVAEVEADCTLHDPTMILGNGSHFSYPYVFKKDGLWYMIPESSSLNEISLYSAVQFPILWKKEKVLLSIPAVDTTVFMWNGLWYLLTFLPVPNTERVEARAYLWSEEGLSQLNWFHYDPLRVRGAGKPFVAGGNLYRPVQVSTDIHYGERIDIVKIIIDGDQYHETFVKRIPPSMVKAKCQFYDGLHTINTSDRFTAIDIRCGRLSWTKPIAKLLKRMHNCFFI